MSANLNQTARCQIPEDDVTIFSIFCFVGASLTSFFQKAGASAYLSAVVRLFPAGWAERNRFLAFAYIQYRLLTALDRLDRFDANGSRCHGGIRVLIIFKITPYDTTKSPRTDFVMRVRNYL